jgi:ELWxxDGT repeat protein
MRKTPLLLFLAVHLSAAAQTPFLVKDINTTLSSDRQSSSPSDFAAYGNKIFFAATSTAAGTELWSTDGTSSGTSMVADIIPGAASSSPSGLKVVNGVLLFNARDVNRGTELWTTDGTAAGTHIFLDINPGPSSSQPANKVLYKNQMLFSADDGTNGRELWTTDGTVAGTHLLKDINPGIASSSPSYFVTMGNVVYFSATGGIWKTDGTPAGTVKVSSVPARNLAVAGSQLFFEGFTSETSWEPWVSDGTDSGTHMVTEILSGTRGALDSNYNGLGFTPFGNGVLFPADDGVHGRELWISDGTAAGTRMVRDFLPGAKGMWDSAFAYITTLGNRAYFSAYDSDHGQELWVTDGTDAGTSLFADLTPGPDGSSPFALIVSSGKLYFAAGSSPFLGSRLWVTDGTAAGTHILGDDFGPGFSNGIVAFWPINGKLYFPGLSTLSGGEPWVTDGTNAGTRMIANIAPDSAPSSFPSGITATDNLLFFYATEGLLSPATSLWRSDGTAAGTFKLESGQDSDPIIAAGPFAFFHQQVNNPAFMISDGTVAGTKPADDFLSRFGTSRLGSLIPFGDTLFAVIEDLGIYDGSLWMTTAAQNAPATQLGARNPFGMIEYSGHWAFYAEGPGGLYDYALWTTDGTRAGTYAIVADFGDTATRSPSPLVNAEGTLFFIAKQRDENSKLWKSDGTLDGTSTVKELPADVNYTPDIEMKAAGRKVFFHVNGSLWVSDGTGAGTLELAKVNNPFSSYLVDDLKVSGDRIAFVQRNEAISNYELWGSDGTVSGTKLLMNLGANNSGNLASIDGTIYFAGVDDLHGTELWTTDGTPEGTKLFLDLNPGPASSNPAEFVKFKDTLYFRAYTDTVGNELWGIPLTEPLVSIKDTHVAEGDSGTNTAHFTVSIGSSSKQTIMIDYTTTDGTARAGDDYESAAGSLTFVPGETTKSLDVRVRGDVTPENNKIFYVTLRNARGARIVRGEAAGIIDDDDQAADLSVAPAFSASGSDLYDAVTVTNLGPRAATDINVQVTATPDYGRTRCYTCVVGQLATGASVSAASDYWPPFQQTYLRGSATARQRDPQASNSAATWTLNAYRTMAVSPAYLTPGATATLTVKLESFFTNTVTSSDPSVISVPASVTAVNNDLGTCTLTALKAGTSVINVGNRQNPLTIMVIPAGTQPRWPGALKLDSSLGSTRFDQPINLFIARSGTAPDTGNRATGTVVVTVQDREVARAVLSGDGLTLPIYLPSIGANTIVVTYPGDASFLPQTLSVSAFANKGSATLSGGLEASNVAGTYVFNFSATGSPAAPPTGTLSILNGAEIARVSLTPSSGGVSIARLILPNLPASVTLTVNYSGDGNYNSGSQQIRAIAPRRHSTAH